MSFFFDHGVTEKGYLGLIQDFKISSLFIIRAAAPPGEYPLNPPAAAADKAARATNFTERKTLATYQIVRTITRNQFAAAINGVHHAALLGDPTRKD